MKLGQRQGIVVRILAKKAKIDSLLLWVTRFSDIPEELQSTCCDHHLKKGVRDKLLEENRNDNQQEG